VRSEKEIRELLRKLEELEQRMIKEANRILFLDYCLKCGAVYIDYINDKSEGKRCDHDEWILESSCQYDDIEAAIKVLKWVLGEENGQRED